MPDPFQDTPNYINPDYASPQQRAQALEYAKALMAKSDTPVNYGAWTQGIANILNAGMGGYEMGKVNLNETQARKQQLAQALGAVRSGDLAQGVGAALNPNNSAEAGKAIMEASMPQVMEDAIGNKYVYNRAIGKLTPLMAGAKMGEIKSGDSTIPTMTSGTLDAPVTRPLVPQQGPQGAPPMPMPPQAPVQQGMMPPAQTPVGNVPARPMIQPSSKVVGDQEGISSGLYENPSATPNTSQSPLGPFMQSLNDYGTKLAAEKERQKTTASEGAKAAMVPVGETMKEAKTAPQAINALNVIEDTARRYGDKITTGPAAEGVLKIKQAVNGLVGSDVMGSTAPAELIKKMNAQLASAALPAFTNRGTQFDLKVFMENNPGLNNSVEGTLFLTNILKQIHGQQLALSQMAMQPGNWGANWGQIQSQYYADHPLINPMTNQPFASEKQTPGQDGGWKDMGGGVKIRPKQ